MQLTSTSTPRTNKYMAPKILSKQVSTKSDVYSFGVLLIQLVNGSPFILDGNEVHIRNGHNMFMWKKMNFNKFSML
jgi:serine/threonine protein kinase